MVKKHICPKCGGKLKQNALGGRRCFEKGCDFNDGVQTVKNKSLSRLGNILPFGRKPKIPVPGETPQVSEELLEFQKHNLNPEKMLRTILYQEQRLAALERQISQLKHQSTLNMVFAQAAVEALITKGVLKESEIKEASVKLKGMAEKKAAGIVKDIPTRRLPPKKGKERKERSNDDAPPAAGNSGEDPPEPEINSAADVTREVRKVKALRKEEGTKKT